MCTIAKLMSIVVMSWILCVQPVAAQDHDAEAPSAVSEERRTADDSRSETLNDATDDDADGYWVVVCWEDEKQDLIICDEIWISSGDANLDGSFDSADF